MKITPNELFDLIRLFKELEIEKSNEIDKMKNVVIEKNNIIKHQDSVIDSMKNGKNITLDIIKKMENKK